MTDKNRQILSVHLADFPDAMREDDWEFGWVGIENGRAVAVLTTTHSKNHGEGNLDKDVPDEWATVQIVYSRGHKFAPDIIAYAQRELAELQPSVVLCRSGVATPEGEAVCASLLLDPRANYKKIRHENSAVPRYRSDLALHKKLIKRLAPGQVAPPAPKEPEHPLPALSRAKATADGHKILVRASVLLGIDAIEPKPDTHEDEAQATT
ncbi:hypothetical protein [Rhodococcus sp. IEGM 1379]|uniref:hypothetical protein n=1 Tax=Rhodococcus sp. IEGM 1379 TaxID=3047086 RepID=UPI0024B83974|nr:hypothetical protein [Rhodococcus sp. IEGM 1379]MDI9915416.1 hypothetical protein [Rhodococcus sp. IEGM 1379]